MTTPHAFIDGTDVVGREKKSTTFIALENRFEQQNGSIDVRLVGACRSPADSVLRARMKALLQIASAAPIIAICPLRADDAREDVHGRRRQMQLPIDMHGRETVSVSSVNIVRGGTRGSRSRRRCSPHPFSAALYRNICIVDGHCRHATLQYRTHHCTCVCVCVWQ